MKIAIHKRPGSFSDHWIEYCKENCIPFKVVNCYDSNIIEQLKDCDALMWHHHHGDFKDVLTAKRILFAIEHAGIKVFPNFYTAWHFDDKVSQKYLLEAIGAPLVPSYVFYDKKKALEWVENTTYPKVFKLRGGAGSANVKLVETKYQAKKFVKIAFGRGFSQFDRLGYLKEKFSKWRQGKETIIGVLKGLARLFISTEFAKMYHREKGYIYFQDFIPNNMHDTRVVVVGDKAAAEKRKVRENDFRASGSGRFSYDDININTVKTAFYISEKLKLQTVAFDFVEDENSNPLIVEMSYCFGTKGLVNAPGYWDRQLNWHDENVNPQRYIIEDFIAEIKQQNGKN